MIRTKCVILNIFRLLCLAFGTALLLPHAWCGQQQMSQVPCSPHLHLPCPLQGVSVVLHSLDATCQIPGRRWTHQLCSAGSPWERLRADGDLWPALHSQQTGRSLGSHINCHFSTYNSFKILDYNYKVLSHRLS